MNIKLFSFLLLLFFYIAFPVYADNEIYDLKKGFIQINEQRLNSTYTIKAFVNKETSTNKVFSQNVSKSILDLTFIYYTNDNKQFTSVRKIIKILENRSGIFYKELKEIAYYTSKGNVERLPEKIFSSSTYQCVDDNTFYGNSILTALKKSY